MDQRGLVERAQRGDQDAFAVLVRASVDRLETAARLILRDPELARDVVQDSYLRAWRDLRGLREPDKFDGWLHRLMVNSCLDVLRRRRRRPIEIEITDLHTPSEADASSLVADRDMINQVLRRLDGPGRAIVVLHYSLGMPLTEVAGVLAIPVGTVKSRLHRALGQMRATAADERPVVAAATIEEGTPA